MTTRTGWGIILAGEPFDLEDWEENLKQPFDPWTVRTEHGLVLRSVVLDGATTSSEAYASAKGLMDQVNGALGVSRGARNLRLDCIAEIMSDGSARRHIFATMAAGEMRCKVRATGVVIGADGKPIPPPPPAPSDPQKWLQRAATDDLLADALTYFARADSWFDIYKALECLEKGAGGENEFLALGWADAGEIKRLKRTANSERHSRLKFDPPPNPMPLSDARSLLAALISRAFQ